MRHIVISPHAEANVWLDEDCAACRFDDAPLTERRRIAAGNGEIVRAQVIVEVAMHVGPRILYGLLGAKLRPAAGDATEIEVPHTDVWSPETQRVIPPRAPFASTLGWARGEGPVVGLEGEFAPAVADALALEAAASWPSSIRVQYAATSMISSSSNTMASLAFALLRISRMTAEDDASLASCIAEAMRTHRGPSRG